jgi:SP family arabinose:H+ symporter-like MFS transporter
LIANFTQFVATLFSAYILARIGRRMIILTGSGIIGIMDVIIGVVFLMLDRHWAPGFPLGMSLIMLFNVVYGLSMGPVVWLYIPEIAKKKIVPIATATYWVGCSLCVIVAPIITNIMNTPYAVFLFFGVY